MFEQIDRTAAPAMQPHPGDHSPPHRWHVRNPVPQDLRDLRDRCRFAPDKWVTHFSPWQELLMPGYTVFQSTVAKYMIQHRGPPSQSWRDFLKDQAGGIAALDLFTVPTIRFDILYALVILAHGSRKILHIAVTGHPTSDWVARQIAEAFPWDSAPDYLLRDNDADYGKRYREQLRAMNIPDIRTAYRSPWQNAYVERVIGSTRRECLDHTIIWNARHLKRTLKDYAEYYNNDRTHLSLGKNTPEGRDLQTGQGKIIALPRVNGLHHSYQRIAD